MALPTPLEAKTAQARGRLEASGWNIWAAACINSDAQQVAAHGTRRGTDAARRLLMLVAQDVEHGITA